MGVRMASQMKAWVMGTAFSEGWTGSPGPASGPGSGNSVAVDAQRHLAKLRTRFQAVKRGMHIVECVFAVDHRPQAGAFDKAEQVAELAQVAQAGAKNLQLAHEDAAQIGARLVAGGGAAGDRPAAAHQRLHG